MARKLRIEYPGAIYHVYARGNAYCDIYLDDRDCSRYLDLLNEARIRFRWELLSYNLMVNHDHLQIRTLEANLSRGMHWINTSYTQLFNKRHGRVGHLFQGRFKDTLVQNGTHAAVLSRYIALNPVRKKWVNRPDEWKWSSYGALIGKERPHPCLNVQAGLECFGDDMVLAQKEYEAFVLAGIGMEPPDLYRPIFGNKDFISEKIKLIGAKRSDQEFPTEERRAPAKSLATIFVASALENIDVRNEAIWHAVMLSGYSQKDVAQHLGLHYTQVSRIMARKRICGAGTAD